MSGQSVEGESETRHGEAMLGPSGGKPGAPSLYACWTLPVGTPRAVVGVIHGYADHAQRYAHVMDAWAEKGVASIAIDLRGHGRSEGPRGACNRFDEYLDDVAMLRQQIDEKAPGTPRFLFGHSFGGLIATMSVLVDPSPWKGLVVTSPLFGLAVKAPPLKVLAGRVASKIVPSLSLASGMRGVDVTRHEERARAYDEDPLVFSTANARWFTEAERAQTRALARAPLLKIPLSIIQGTADRLSELAATRVFFRDAGSADKNMEVRAGAFHEVLNDPDWREPTDHIADWVLARA